MSENKSLTYEHAPIPGRGVLVGLVGFLFGVCGVGGGGLKFKGRGVGYYIINMGV
jgi:hypothetical protein